MLVKFDSPRIYDNLLENLFSTDVMPSRCETPAMDIVEKDNEFVVKAEVPGVKKEDVKITFEKNVLSLSSERKSVEQSEDTKVLIHEISLNGFNRSVKFSDEINSEKISAELNNGILTITLPKTDEVKAREINIQ